MDQEPYFTFYKILCRILALRRLPLRGFAITLTGHITLDRTRWTSDQPHAQISASQHTDLQAPGGNGHLLSQVYLVKARSTFRDEALPPTSR